MAQGSLWRSARPLMAGRACSALIGVLLPVLLARRLGQAEYGTYKQLFLLSGLALNSLQFGLSQSLFYFVPRAVDERERSAYVGQTQAALTLLGLLVFAGLQAAAPAVAERFTNPDLARLSVPIGLLAGALIASSPLEVALTARGRPGLSALALVCAELAKVLAMLVPVLLGRGVEGLAWGAALASVGRWAAAVVVSARPGALGFGWAHARRQLAYALPYGLAVLLSMPQQQLHQVFLAARETPALFALYAVGVTQIPVVSLLYSPVSETLQVRLAGLERTGETHLAGQVFADAVDRLAFVFLPLCALLMATARWSIELLYGAAYAPAAAVMQVAVASVAVASLPLDGVLKARAKTGTLFVLYAAKLAVTWPLLASGYRLFGMQGVIGAHVGVELLTKSVQLAVISRDLKVPARSLLGARRLGRSLVIAVLTLVCAGAVAGLIARPLLSCAAAGLVACALVGADWALRRRSPGARPTDRVRKAA